MAKKIEFTDEQINTIKDMYTSGIGSCDISKKFNVSEDTIRKRLRETGIEIRPFGMFLTNKDDINKVIKMYENGYHITEIQKEFGVSNTVIDRIIKTNGIFIENHQRKHHIDDNAFSCDLNTNEKAAYFIGMFMSDGYVQTDGNCCKFVLSLQAEDEDVIIKLKDYLKTDYEIKTEVTYNNKFNEPRENKYLRCISNKIVREMNKYGIVQSKSKIAQLTGGAQYNKHVWRGMIDGDGGVYYGGNKHPSIGLTGTYENCFLFSMFIYNNIVTDYIIKPQPDHDSFSISSSGEKAYKIIDYLYGNSSVYMNRKYNVYKYITENYKNNYKQELNNTEI